MSAVRLRPRRSLFFSFLIFFAFGQPDSILVLKSSSIRLLLTLSLLPLYYTQQQQLLLSFSFFFLHALVERILLYPWLVVSCHSPRKLEQNPLQQPFHSDGSDRKMTQDNDRSSRCRQKMCERPPDFKCIQIIQFDCLIVQSINRKRHHLSIISRIDSRPAPCIGYPQLPLSADHPCRD